MAHNGYPPIDLTNCPCAERLPCYSHAASRILLVRPDNRVPRLTCGNLGYSGQKKCIPIGYRQHADRSLCSAEPDWMQQPADPAAMLQAAQPCARTYRVLTVIW